MAMLMSWLVRWGGWVGGRLCSRQVSLGILTIHKTVEINLSLGDFINLSLCAMSRRDRGRERERGGNNKVEK